MHHEDIRRGTPGWAERKVTPALSEALWRRLGMARFVLRKAPVGVELVRDDITTDPGQGRVRITAKARTPVVTVTGAPGELTLWTSGRRDAAQVRLDGTEAAVRTLTGVRWGRNRGGFSSIRALGRGSPGRGRAQVTPRRRPGHGVITGRRGDGFIPSVRPADRHPSREKPRSVMNRPPPGQFLPRRFTRPGHRGADAGHHARGSEGD